MWVFLAASGELLLHLQPRACEEASEPPDTALQMFSSWAGCSHIGLVGTSGLSETTALAGEGSTPAARFSLGHFLLAKLNLVFIK